MSVISVWCEGYQATGESAGACLLGSVEASDFDAAVRALIASPASPGRSDSGYFHRKDDGTWTYWGCRLFDNEADARKSFG